MRFDHHIVDEQIRVVNAVEDLLGVAKISEQRVCCEGHELVERVYVLVDAKSEE